MIFLIILGAAVYNAFLALTQLPQEAARYVVEAGFSPWLVLAAVLGFYLLFGCVMESLSMILLTVPIFFPVLAALDFGLGAEDFALWFGVLVLVVVEVGLITPPVGMNLFIIQSMAPDISITDTWRGVLPFVIADLLRILLLAAFPAIALAGVRLFY
jgi:C4-dicarboxylate transporter DctM subunit